MAARKIVIDTDPGTDDAVAILLALAAPEMLDVLGIVAVAGNVPLTLTASNARRIVALAGRSDIPVHAGCARPIGGGSVSAETVHGVGGLGTLLLPPAETPLAEGHGVDYLVDLLRHEPAGSVTLCALGPLTNIAMALIKMPEIAGRVAELVLMGGASRALGNITPAAEFNIYADPMAAAIVLASGMPTTVMPLDATHQVLSSPLRIERIRGLGNRCGEAVAALLASRPGGRFGAAGAPLHDPCVIAYLLRPDLFDGAEVNVAVETASPLTLGTTVVDWRGVSGRKPNARIMQTVNAEEFYALLTQRLSVLP